MQEPRGSRPPRVVILGGGFGGLYCARALKSAPVDVLLIDRRNFHVFQPLLYQVALAALSPADIAYPIRNVLRKQQNTEVWMAEARSVDVKRGIVRLADSEVSYDYLIVATGATHAYFGHPEWEQFAPGLKTIEDATEMRRRFLLAFEAAEREADPAARRRLLTFVIVGAGPTGVELAGSMAEMARDVMPQDFRAIDTSEARILLLEGGQRVLPTYPEDLSAKAKRQLENLGVEIRTGALVTSIDATGVTVASRERIEANNVFWAAGVLASPIGATLAVATDKAGRVTVENDCSIPGHPNVFVIGDLAHFVQDGKPVPGVAPAAMQMGKHVARTIRDDLKGKPRSRFHYNDKGSLATIGRAAAVAEIARLHLSGLIAWIVWVFVHIMYLIGFRNRIIVMIQWAWAYLRFSPGMRLITGEARIELSDSRSPISKAAD